jgi:carbon-monoxide dehydrogenase large subunit
MTTEVLGAPVKRVEDRRLITGKGRYVDDISLPALAHMAILRSPYAHANIKSIDVSVAKTLPGVLDVLVGADVPYNPLPMAWPAGGSAGIQNNVNTPRALATDSVKWNGEGVAAVVAETPEQAADAVEAILVDWDPLPAVVDAEAATKPGAPQLHENAPNNIVFEWSVGDKDGTSKAIDGAEVVVKQRLVNQRRTSSACCSPPSSWASRSTRSDASARTSAGPSARRSSPTPTTSSSCSPRSGSTAAP